MKKTAKNKGFTLVEVIVVLVILAILAAISIPALTGYIDEAKDAQAISRAKQWYTAAQAVASKAYVSKSLTIADDVSGPGHPAAHIYGPEMAKFMGEEYDINKEMVFALCRVNNYEIYEVHVENHVTKRQVIISKNATTGELSYTVTPL